MPRDSQVPHSTQPPTGCRYAVLRARIARWSCWWSQVHFAGPGPVPADPGPRYAGLLLLLLAALLLFPKLDRPLLDPDEGRQAEVAREMLAHGDLVLPRLRGLPYHEKPPLQYWLTAAAYGAWGAHAWCARLVPAAAAWLIVLVTYAWGRRAFGERPALLGGLTLCLTPGFVLLGRTVVLDTLLALCVVTAWYAAHVAVGQPGVRWRWWFASAVACGLGILAKGPVSLALVVPPVLAYQALTVTAARPRRGAWGAYAAVALAVASPWYAAMAVRQPGYLHDFLWRNNVVRYVNAFDHDQPWWFYLPVLFAATLPWPLLWPALGRVLSSRRPDLAELRTPALGFCVLSLGWSWVFFSLATCKSPPYLAPLFSPLALLLGICLDALLFRLAGQLDGRLFRMREALPARAALLVLVLAAGGALATGVLGWQPWGGALPQTAVAAAAALAWWAYSRRARPAVAWKVCSVATLALVLLVAHALAPSFAARRTPVTAARAVHGWPHGDERPVVLYGRDWFSALFYLERETVVYAEQGEEEELIEFLRDQPEAFVLVESGQPLEDLLAVLPDDLEAGVRHPGCVGQAALVVVRPHSP